MISWGDIGGKRKPSRFTPVSPTWKTSFYETFFLKLFLHHLYYEFIISMDYKWCIRPLISISCNEEMCFIRETINTATSNSFK